MGIRRTHINTNKARTELSLRQVFFFYLFVLFLILPISLLLRQAGWSALESRIVDSGLYGLLLIPVAYKLDSRIFSRPYWRYPSRAWVGVGIIILVQLVIDTVHPVAPIGVYRRFSALLAAPIAEESARAVVIRPLTERLGATVGLIITALMWAVMHQYFWVAVCQQLILSLIFVYTRRSLSSCIVAHTAMNIIAAWNISFQTVHLH
jgi:membrane protease YdiL (CAAX protease family)